MLPRPVKLPGKLPGVKLSVLLSSVMCVEPCIMLHDRLPLALPPIRIPGAVLRRARRSGMILASLAPLLKVLKIKQAKKIFKVEVAIFVIVVIMFCMRNHYYITHKNAQNVCVRLLLLFHKVFHDFLLKFIYFFFSIYIFYNIN